MRQAGYKPGHDKGRRDPGDKHKGTQSGIGTERHEEKCCRWQIASDYPDTHAETQWRVRVQRIGSSGVKRYSGAQREPAAAYFFRLNVEKTSTDGKDELRAEGFDNLPDKNKKQKSENTGGRKGRLTAT